MIKAINDEKLKEIEREKARKRELDEKQRKLKEMNDAQQRELER